MRTFLVIFILSLVCIACEREKKLEIDYLIPENEVPEWLRICIKNDLEEIQKAPECATAYGSWRRYMWKNDFYFEYNNPLSSTFPVPITFSGDSLPYTAIDVKQDYNLEKCCELYVWKGPKYGGT
jgi:hypothetical protein